MHGDIAEKNKILEQAACERVSGLKKNFALDYGPTLRAICRTEKLRMETNLKRMTANRFYHYFRTIDVDLKTNVLNSLCDCLC